MKMVGLVIVQIIIIGVFAWVIINHIEKHSTHPIHGNFVETSYKCQPWDSCR
jgi:hypothetical protein